PAEKCVQVSMNLVDYRRTSPAQVYRRIAELAAEAGVSIRNSEVVGLLPQEALELCGRQMAEADGADAPDAAAYAINALKLTDFDPNEQVIERKMESTMSEAKFPYLAGTREFLADLASANPTPGGGAAVAVLGAT